jgi:hypothetical protein
MRMRLIRTLVIIATLFSLLSGFTATAQEKELIIVATKATFEAAQKWVDFLTFNEVPFKHVTPRDFGKYQKNPFVVLMGGMDEPDGIKALATEILSADELKSVTQKGSGEMIFKFKAWDPMQTVIVFAGSDRAAAEAARIREKRDLFNLFITWFDLDADIEDQFHVY